MNTRIAIVLAGALVLGACAQKVSDKTVLMGSFDNKCPDVVTVSVPALGIDTTLTVDPATHTFRFEMPTDRTALATVEYEDGGAQFVPDGTTLMVHFTDEYESFMTSKQPKVSVTMKLKEYSDKIGEYYRAYRYAETQEAADSVMALTQTLSENLLNENKDNLLSVAAIFNLMQDYSDIQVDSIIRTLDPKVREMDDIRQLESSLKIRLQTGEGKPFKDFTVVQPNGKAVSLSDFAGKGKYILLDFWASWCGPCKREVPAIRAAYDQFHGPEFDVVSVAVWDQDVKASVDAAKAYGMVWNHIVDARTLPTELYGVDGIPHLILIGPNGTILKRDLRGEEIAAEVGKYVQPVK